MNLAAYRRLGLTKLASIGKKADLDEVDLLTYFASDEDTRVIAGYIESISSGDDFVLAAEKAANEKPVTILKCRINRRSKRDAAATEYSDYFCK